MKEYNLRTSSSSLVAFLFGCITILIVLILLPFLVKPIMGSWLLASVILGILFGIPTASFICLFILKILLTRRVKP